MKNMIFAIASVFMIGISGQAIAEDEFLIGDAQSVEHDKSSNWFPNLHADLPRTSRDGIYISYPDHGGHVSVDMKYSPELFDRLEPLWRYDAAARQRLENASNVLWQIVNMSYMEWSKHLDYDHGKVIVLVGNTGDYNCGHGNSPACYSDFFDAVILDTNWIIENYFYLTSSNDFLRQGAIRELFAVIMHEAGHQFGYQNPTGMTEGCGGGNNKCHDHYGSNGIMSYDTIVNLDVTPEDVRYINHATWNDEKYNTFFIWKTGEPDSIRSWGVWLDQDFDISGQHNRRTFTGLLDFQNTITANGYIAGTPSNTLPSTSATYSGTDNFLGVDMDPNYLGALLRADANLRYTFHTQNMNVRINDFEAHYSKNGVSTWHDHNYRDWGDFSYDLNCVASGCSGNEVQTKWYESDAGDPTGWVGGVVNDTGNEYVGSFVAEKD